MKHIHNLIEGHIGHKEVKTFYHPERVTSFGTPNKYVPRGGTCRLIPDPRGIISRTSICSVDREVWIDYHSTFVAIVYELAPNFEVLPLADPDFVEKLLDSVDKIK